jgi:hypothetical protein
VNFRSYLGRLHDILYSRRDIRVEHQDIVETDVDAVFTVRVRFLDDSLLIINEELEIQGKRRLQRAGYVFHYQRVDGALIFRYDNSPHYPQLATFPDHKHVGDTVITAEPPDLAEVLREIDAIIYSGTNQ